MKAPFPWPGGKSHIASAVWSMLGRPDHYIEPFAGSLAVLLARPDWHKNKRLHETCGDASARIAHLWRAMKLRPSDVAAATVWPLHEVDYHARHRAVIQALPHVKDKLLDDPHWCDPEIAGWEIWGLSSQIGQDWMRENKVGARPANPNVGVHAKWFDLSHIEALGERLRYVATLYGDWRRCVASSSALRGPLIGSPSEKALCVGVFLDPPYTPTLNLAGATYGTDGEADVAAQVRRWCTEWGDRPWLRIVLAGHAGEHDALLSYRWRRTDWKAEGFSMGGYARVVGDDRAPRHESLWSSPACLSCEQADLFAGPAQEPTP